MHQVILPLYRVQICSKCVAGFMSKSNISTTAPLLRVKRQQRPYRPGIQPFEKYGKTHRLVRGESTDFKRYGPLFEKPDYTFLDGRPTPLTPEQREQREINKQMAEKVVKSVKEIRDVQDFYQGLPKMEEKYIAELSKRRLKPKS